MLENNQLARRDAGVSGVAGRAYKALQVLNSTGSGLQALTSFLFPTGLMGEGSRGNVIAGWLSIERRDFPYRNVNAYNSSIVMACINAMTGAFKEGRLIIYRYRDDGTKVELPNHKLIRLLRRPNRFYSYSKLMSVALMSYLGDGNGYIFKERAQGGYGATRALYYVPHYMIEPVQERVDGSSYIDYYRYTNGAGVWRIPPDRIIHLKYDVDPYNPLKGRSPVAPVLSEIYTDEEAARFTAALVRNSAIPGLVIAPTDDTDIDAELAEEIKKAAKLKFGGDSRGEPMVLNFKANVTPLGFSPKDMDLRDVRRLPEERVAAQYRIAPAFAGLGAGLDRSTYSNYEQAERSSYHNCIVPLWLDIAEALSTDLLPEFVAGDADSDTFGLEYDYSAVRALQENADAIASRTTKLYIAGGITRAELRAANSFPVDEARDNIFYYETRTAPAPNPITGGTGGGEKRGLISKVKAALLLKEAGTPNLDAAFRLALEAEINTSGAQMGRELDGLLKDIGEEAQRLAANVDTLNPEAETERILGEALEKVAVGSAIAAIFARMAEEVTDSGKLAVAFRLGLQLEDVWDEMTEAGAISVLKAAASRYEEALRSQSKEAILEAIRGAEAGLSKAQIARRIKGMVEGRSLYPGIYQEGYKAAKKAGATDEQAERAGDAKARRYRASLIADAESRTYQNHVTLGAFEKSGRVKKVKVTDGDACGWRSHDDTDKAHGSQRLIGDARRYALAHPNCKRRFYPVTQEPPAPQGDAGGSGDGGGTGASSGS